MKQRLKLMILAGLLGLSMTLFCLWGSGGVLEMGHLMGPEASVDATRERFVLLELRLPRVLVAALIGAALASSGGALQGLFRNPLADPSLLGVSAGAALFAQLAIYSGLGDRLPWVLPVFATGGAALTLFALLYLLRGGLRGALEWLLLGGTALTQLAAAASALLLSLAVTDFTRGQKMLRWMLGSLDARSFMHVLWGAGPVLLGVLLLVREARALDALSLGEVTARSMGVDVPRVRTRVVWITAVLSGTAVAIGGIVGFVGLLAPHLTRATFGSRHAVLLPASAVFGALLLVLCDGVSRVVWAPNEVQLGVVTAALGAPWFIWVIYQRAQRGGA